MPLSEWEMLCYTSFFLLLGFLLGRLQQGCTSILFQSVVDIQVAELSTYF